MDAQIGGFFKKISVGALGLLTGVGLALVLTQYPGVFEVRLGLEESSIKMDGSPKCDLIAQPEK